MIKTATLSWFSARDYVPLSSITSARATNSRQFEAVPPSSAFRPKLPSLDFSNSQVGAGYWPGANASSGAVGGPPSNTLPTPPTTESDVFKPPSQSRESPFNVANGALQQPGLSSTAEPPGGAGSSLTARRPAASSLPSFELPPPQTLQSRYLPYSSSTINSQPPSASVNVSSLSNLLTPPSHIPGDSHSPISAGGHSISSAASNGLPPYTASNSYWPSGPSGIPSFSTGTSTTPQPSWAHGSVSSGFPNRPMFSPSLNSLVRNSSSSPSTSEGLPPPPPTYEVLPPFNNPMPLPNAAPLATTANHQAAAQASAQASAHAYLNPPTPVSSSATQSAPLIHASESYLQRPPPTPTYFNGPPPSSTPQQSHFPPVFSTDSPMQQSPIGPASQPSRISPVSAHLPNLQSTPLPPTTPGYLRTFPTYTLPGMTGAMMAGPIMSNMHSPGGQMSIVGGMPSHGVAGGMMPTFNSGHSAQMQSMYGTPAQTAHSERPFRCDQCPQSFNRNHDLKRHKRIHLAVKPFPCGHCDKSFSRKDALKVSFLPLRRPRCGLVCCPPGLTLV